AGAIEVHFDKATRALAAMFQDGSDQFIHYRHNRPARLGHLQGRDPGYLLAQYSALETQLVVRLQVHPEFLGCTEVPRKSYRRISRNPSLARSEEHTSEL